MDNKTLRDLLGERLMIATRGYKNRSDFPREWNEEDPDSQFAMVLEDVDIIIGHLDELGILNRSNNLEVQAMTGAVQPPTVTYTSNSATTSVTYPAPTKTGITKSSTVNINLSAGSTLGELEEFVETLKELKVSPDDVVVSNPMNYSVTLLDCGVERIACGECNYMDYIIFPNDHECILD